MTWYLIKLGLTAVVIVLVSEIAKKLPLLGSLIASLPLISVLGMIWMYWEIKEPQVMTKKIADHSEGTFWYVLPSLPMFLVMPWMMRKGISFPVSMLAGIALTGILYFLTTKILDKFFGMSL